MIDENQVESVKVILIGNSGVGKTSIINQYISGQFNPSSQTTIGVYSSNSFIKCEDGKVIGLKIWDTAGQERYRSMSKSFFQNSQVVILVYDITDESSFDEIKNDWYPSAKQEAKENAIMVLVGNKEDLVGDDNDREKVNEDTARKYAKKINALYFRISAKSNEKIVDLFEQIVKKYRGKKVVKTLQKEEYEEYQKMQKNSTQLDAKGMNKANKKNCC